MIQPQHSANARKADAETASPTFADASAEQFRAALPLAGAGNPSTTAAGTTPGSFW